MPRGLGALGFNFDALIGIGANAAGQIVAAASGQPVAPVYSQTGVTSTSTGLSSLTSSPLFVPALLVGAYLLLKK